MKTIPDGIGLIIGVILGLVVGVGSQLYKPQAPKAIAPDASFTIDFTAPKTPISPLIYGSNMYEEFNWDGSTRGFTFGRLGGNRWTGYNWENNASNAGVDWQHQNDGYLGGGETTGMAAQNRIEKITSSGATALATIPMLDYVSADKNGDGDVAKTPDYLNRRFKKSIPAKSGTLPTTPNVNDGEVYQNEFANFIMQRFKGKQVYFSLDNEPDLWDQTHPRIHPYKQSYQEHRDRTLNTARAIKRLNPNAVIFGGVLSGYYGFMRLGGASDHSNRFYIDFFLQEMKRYSDMEAKRLIDVLDIHWYPEHRGSNNIRIIEDDSSLETARARIQAPRSLWDDTFKENSWIANDVTRGPIKLIPDLSSRINRFYPGTKLAVTEYYYGGGGHISGAIAQSDVLGIFGSRGVFAANLWHLGKTDDRFIYAAFKIFRDYDGRRSSFGDLSVKVSGGEPSSLSVYASENSSNGKKVIVIINKTESEKNIRLNLIGKAGAQNIKPKTFILTQRSSEITAGNELKSAQGSGCGDEVYTYLAPALSVTVVELQ